MYMLIQDIHQNLDPDSMTPIPHPLRPTDLLAMSVLTVADRVEIPRFIAAYPAVPLGFFPVMRRDRQILCTHHILQVNRL